MLTLKIDTRNAAFDDRTYSEVARILRDIADRIEAGNRFPLVIDTNGNIVGKCKLTGAR